MFFGFNIISLAILERVNAFTPGSGLCLKWSLPFGIFLCQRHKPRIGKARYAVVSRFSAAGSSTSEVLKSFHKGAKGGISDLLLKADSSGFFENVIRGSQPSIRSMDASFMERECDVLAFEWDQKRFSKQLLAEFWRTPS